MIKLNDNELLNIEGGAWSLGAVLAVGGFVTFIIGVIDGYVRPLRCNK